MYFKEIQYISNVHYLFPLIAKSVEVVLFRKIAFPLMSSFRAVRLSIESLKELVYHLSAYPSTTIYKQTIRTVVMPSRFIPWVTPESSRIENPSNMKSLLHEMITHLTIKWYSECYLLDWNVLSKKATIYRHDTNWPIKGIAKVIFSTLISACISFNGRVSYHPFFKHGT